jgi:hypothetical protein
MGRAVPPNTALGLAPCDWVHTFGMRHAIDVAYCDVKGQVLHVCTLRPNRFGPRVRKTEMVWEAEAGAFTSVRVGDCVQIRER